MLKVVDDVDLPFLKEQLLRSLEVTCKTNNVEFHKDNVKMLFLASEKVPFTPKFKATINANGKEWCAYYVNS